MRNIYAILFFLFTSTLFAQPLPAGFTPEEENIRYQYFQQLAEKSFVSQNPPASPVRTMAEWEEVQGYLIAWTSYPSMLREIVRYGKEECRMYVLTANASSVRSDLSNNGIDTTNVTFLNIPFNSVWSRDYAQWCTYKDDVDSMYFVDWIYNRPRPKDDSVPKGLALHLQVPLYQMTQGDYGLVNTGGNFMADGLGTAFASNLVLEENAAGGGFNQSHTEADINQMMQSFMGIDQYIKMGVLPYDGIHHIDMHMKLLDEQTLLVGQYPPGVADGPAIEANLQYVLSNFTTPYGTPYRVIRIPMPSDGGAYPNTSGRYLTYTNASFINKTIIVPIYGIAQDQEALNIWRAACPGYRVVGILSNASIGASGALHCITKEIGVQDPLWITHQRLEDTYETTQPYPVSARIQHRLGISNAMLYYKTDSLGAYIAVPMTPQANNQWAAAIPSQPAGTTVFYYVQATANGGKVQQRPIAAPEGFYRFRVLQTVDIDELSSSNVLIYPNPSRGLVCLDFRENYSKVSQVLIRNAAGQVVESLQANGKSKLFVNTANWTAGCYFAEVSDERGNKTVQKMFVR